jgi:hypothetical protein
MDDLSPTSMGYAERPKQFVYKFEFYEPRSVWLGSGGMIERRAYRLQGGKFRR